MMGSTKMIVSGICIIVTMTAPISFAEGLAISAKSGTLGVGGDLTIGLFEGINTRIGASGLSLDFDENYSGIDYDVGLDLFAYSGLIDWYPFGDDFHISGGVVINRTDIDLSATSNASITINGQSYSAAEAGQIDGAIDFDEIAPYVGIGWGNALNKQETIGFMLDLGVAFIGSPKAELTGSGTLAGDPTFQANLAAEQRDIQDEIDDYKIYPVISFCLYFRF